MKQQCARCGEKFKIHRGEIWRNICEECSVVMEDERILDQTIENIGKCLEPEKAAIFATWTKEKQREFAQDCWDIGAVRWVGFAERKEEAKKALWWLERRMK